MVGVGGFGEKRRKMIRESGLFTLAVAYDLSSAALAACQNQDGAAPANSYEELLETPGIEAVFISTGAKFHCAQALAAMEKGLHVFVEKPVCSTEAELDALAEAHARTGVVFSMGHADHTHDALSVEIKRQIDTGELGKVAAVEKTTCHSGGLHIQLGDWRGDPDKNPGGMLFQCGVHALHELMFYFGPVRRVACTMRYDVHSTKTADTAQCLLEFASGLTGTLNAYHVTPYRHSMNIYGTKRNIYINARFGDEGTIMQTQHIDATTGIEPVVPLVLTGEDDELGGLKSFYNAICHGTEPYPSFADGARAVSVVFAAEKAAKTGGFVDVDFV